MVNIVLLKASKIIDEILTLKWLALGITIFLFGWSQRNYLIKSAGINKTEINSWDVFISTTSDVYLIFYFLFPMLIYIMINLIIREYDYTIIIRYGSYKRWIWNLQKSFFMYIGITFFIWLLVTLVLSIGLPYSNTWSNGSEMVLIEPLVLQQYFSHPFIPFVLQLLSFITTLYLIHTFLCILYVIFKNKIVIVLIGLSLFLVTIVSFKILPTFFKESAPANYLLFYHGVLTFDSKLISIFIVSLSSIAMYLLTLKIDKIFLLRKFPSQNLWHIIYFSLYLMGVIIQAYGSKKQNLNILDVFLTLFQGTSSQGYQYISYLFYIIVYMGFVYLMHVELDKEVSRLSYYRIIRYRSLYRWYGSWLKKICLTIIMFLIFIFGFSLIIFLLVGINFNLESKLLPDINVYLVLFQFFINGFLQLLFYILLLWIIRWFTSDSTQNLLIFGVLLVLLIPGIKFLPVGLNGLAHLADIGNPISITYILIIYIAIQSLFILYLLKKRVINN